MTNKTKKTLGIVLKVAILVSVAWVLYQKLNDHQNLKAFERLMHNLGTHTVVTTLSVVVVLMFANWLLEVVKWQYLCRPIERISFWRATQSVFCGLSWAVFTPNRIGEYGGRVMFLQPRKRIFGVVAMGVGALAQLVLTSVAGSLSIAWFVNQFFEVSTLGGMAIWLLAGLYAGFFLMLYFNVRWINSWMQRMKFLRKFHRFFEILTRYDRGELTIVFLNSLARFVIFTSQYCILMLVIIPDIAFLPMLLLIFILFFVQAALPTLDLFDFGVRSVTASYLYAHITDQDIAVMAIASCVWFINLILPAILGSVFVLKINFFGDATN
ncbi:lysylphosphatidylglycerol synthase domain-containing protein [Parapedobacter sp. 10938]|uniref:lysylphosphatidylglycerol synthase domain-containing protein n=1 Tax=Parapedobacter flavus TaxID=3110225 RepID=UPI002DBF11FE|nr:lysylphosphatidylglycerol synthase domain-containing protein [Parapedobacter sp. 10938]MEC3879413.1 lysylphosphatidylglycerol synthase domain-containing protein [Parapedobacter sp. 10938]